MKQLLLLFILISTLTARAQVELENNPPSIRWNQVNTPHFRVIFPQGFDEQGIRMANTLEHIYQPEARSLGSYPRKIPIILQNQSAASNGFVSILPRRSEFYAMPSQDYNFIGSNDWLNLLASHEYRHVVQFQHSIRGFNKLFYYLFGAPTLVGMSQVAAPDWFWEGDAVVTETAFTRGGRGKIPNFGLVFRTNLLEGRTFNYHKQYLRSYKHNIPDHYVLGYHMISYLRKRTGDPEIWGKITARTWNVPFIPFAFSSAIKKEAGLTVTRLYKEMARDLQKEWKSEIDGLTLTPFERVSVNRRRAYTDYLYPHPQQNGSVIAMKKGIGNIEEFVLLQDGREKKIFTPGFINDTGMMSVSGSVIVWNEYGYDPRWSVRNYSLTKAINSGTRKKYVVGSKKDRLAGAALGPDQRTLAVVRTTTEYKTNLLVQSFPEGKEQVVFPNDSNYFFSMPRWSPAGDQIVVLVTSDKGKAISIADVQSKAVRRITPWSNENYGYPVFAGDYVLFNSPLTGIDNIFALSLANGDRYQVTNSKYGAYNPALSPDGKTLYYNDQTRDGLDIVSTSFDPSSWKKLTNPVVNTSAYQHLLEQEGHGVLFDNVPKTPLPVTRYRKYSGLVNPYSWGFYFDEDLIHPRVAVASQDILSTTRIEAGYEYDINERTSQVNAMVSYQGLFPIIDVSASLANRTVNEGLITLYDTLEDPAEPYDQELIFKWKEKNIEAGLRVPLVTTSSRFSGKVTIANHIGLTQVSDFTNNINDEGRIITADQTSAYFFLQYADNGNLLYNNLSFTAYRFLKQSRRDINSKWGQYITVDYLSTPFGGDFEGKLLSATAITYFPGLMRHHSLWVYGAHQYTFKERAIDSRDNYYFRNNIPLPRGQSVRRFENFSMVAANYSLPVWYPDIALGPLLNIQRLRATLFYDYGTGQDRVFSDPREVYHSAGIEAKVDLNFFRLSPKFDLGVRFTRGLSPQTTEFEILIGTINF